MITVGKDKRSAHLLATSHLCSSNEQRQLGDRPVSLSPLPVSLLRGRARGPRVTGMPDMFHTLTGRPYLANPLYTLANTQIHTLTNGEYIHLRAGTLKLFTCVYLPTHKYKVKCAPIYIHTKADPV